jgi:hypothetical protein
MTVSVNMNMIGNISDTSSIWIPGKFGSKAVCGCVCTAEAIVDNRLYRPVPLVFKQCTVRHCIIMEAGQTNIFGCEDNRNSRQCSIVRVEIEWRSSGDRKFEF